ncbi:DUF817 family protein [Rathayibacter tritici]|uniref:Uncharacterized protein n=1 Tax=Rathayibacter tritici TaxID=33888 RepID=A0A160KQY5_9MICO|nr:DUF817 family protein [Rathayibacter tritici]AND15639.1 hypothetical protein A6122_0480 [Rathayibacter tritici]PPI45617.1 DUF817 domain-containing protein [Rathayibacter tritici]
MGTPDAAGPGTTMVYRVHRGTHRMPLLVAFTLVALFIGIAESIATSAGAWLYPDQVVGWQPVSVSTLVSWFLLMIVSVLLARPPAARTGRDSARRPPPADHRRLTAERPPRPGSVATPRQSRNPRYDRAAAILTRAIVAGFDVVLPVRDRGEGYTAEPTRCAGSQALH